MRWNRGVWPQKIRRPPRIERGDEGARPFARQPVQAPVGGRRRARLGLLPRLPEMARRAQQQKDRCEGPGAEKGREPQSKRLKLVIFLGRKRLHRTRFLWKGLFPGRQRPVAQPQRKDTEGGG